MDELRKGIAIGMLFGSGGEGHGNLMEKTATENGTYTAAEEIDPETGEIFDPPKDGYSVFTVDLALDDKSVSITTSQITGSQTAEFEYDPHDENPELEGYSLFTIDLSGVKDDIEELQQTIDDINQLLEEDDPDYDPTTDDPVQQVNDIIEEKDQIEKEVEECEECRAEVIAKLQEYDPDFDPQTCEDIPPEIEKIHGIDVPIGVDPVPIAQTLGAATQGQGTIDGKNITFEFAGYGYYPSSSEHYTEAAQDAPVYDYLSGTYYTAFDENITHTGYTAIVYSVQIEGQPKYYTFGVAAYNPQSGWEIKEIEYVSQNAVSIKSETNFSTGINSVTGKNFDNTTGMKII